MSCALCIGGLRGVTPFGRLVFCSCSEGASQALVVRVCAPHKVPAPPQPAVEQATVRVRPARPFAACEGGEVAR